MAKSIFISIILSTILLTSPLAFSQDAVAGIPPREEYKCYPVTEAATPTVSLRDQFGDMENVQLNGLSEFCASATKTIETEIFESPHGFGNHLNCYDLPEMEAPKDPTTGEPFVVDLGGMGQFDDEIDVEIGIPKKLCNPTTKKITTPGLSQDEFIPNDPNLTHYKCYEITGSLILDNVNLKDQFLPEGEFHSSFEPILFCNPVIKIIGSAIPSGTPKAPSGPHLKCYNIDAGSIKTPFSSILSTDQFDSYEFIIPEPGKVCTEVTKNIKSGRMAVGGEMIPLDTTMILLAGTHSVAAWMIPIIVSTIGIGIVIARKF